MGRRRTLMIAAVVAASIVIATAVVALVRRNGGQSDTAQPGSVVLLGDSITAGGDWARLLPDATIANYGRPGFTTEQLVPVAAEVASRTPRAVFVLTGTNDIRDGRPAEWSAGNLRELLDRLATAAGTTVVVQTVLPRGDRPDEVEAINQAIVETATEAGVAVVDLHPDFDDGNGALRPEETTDGIHLSAAGYERWAGILEPLVADPESVGNDG
jgi:lysophospholipase L1-like esterase